MWCNEMDEDGNQTSFRGVTASDINDACRDLSVTSFEELRVGFIERASGDNENGWFLLGHMCSLYLSNESALQPFGIMLQTSTGRSMVLGDLDEAQGNDLSQLVGKIDHADLNAHIADICWLILKRPEFAVAAVNAYLEAFPTLEHWPEAFERIRRALTLSRMVRKYDESLLKAVTQIIHHRIGEHAAKPDDASFLPIKLIGLLLDQSAEDEILGYWEITADFLRLWDKSANQFEALLELRADLANKFRDQEKIEATTRDLAEHYAEHARNFDAGLGSAHWMQKAITVARNLPNSSEYVASLYEELREMQVNARSQMKTMEGPSIDLGEHIDASERSIDGLTLRDALFKLAFGWPLLSIDRLIDQSKEQMRKYPLQNIFQSTHMDSDGLVVAIVPPAESGLFEGSESDRAVWANVVRQMELEHRITVTAYISPIRRKILNDYRVGEDNWNGFVSNNIFVPRGHEYLFLRALMEGLQGEFLVSTQILVGELENAIRYQLELRGVETSSLNTQGVQERMRLPALLSHETTIEVFGKDNVAELRVLLIDPLGQNIRNRVSHGLFHDGNYYTPACEYLWWTVLRLVLFPIFAPSNESDPTDE